VISPHDYAALLRNDLFAFIHRAFCDLNPQTLFRLAAYIELLASAYVAHAPSPIENRAQPFAAHRKRQMSFQCHRWQLA